MSKPKSKPKSKKPKTLKAPVAPVETHVVKMTYEDAAAVQRREAIDADVAKINTLETAIVDGKQDLRNLVVSILNAEIEQGAALQRICGHEQVNFNFMRDIGDRLPWWGNTKEKQARALEIATSRVAMARMFAGKVITWSDIEKHEMKSVLRQVELLLPGTRGDADLASEPVPQFTAFLAGISKFKQMLQKCWSENPLEQRSKTQLEAFVSDTAWIVEEAAKAKELLRAK